MSKKSELRVPSSVRVAGHQNPVSVDNKGKIKIEETDPRAPIKTSPFSELQPATDEWITKYGGSDVSIVAYNVSILLKEKANAKENSGKKGSGKNDSGENDRRLS